MAPPPTVPELLALDRDDDALPEVELEASDEEDKQLKEVANLEDRLRLSELRSSHDFFLTSDPPPAIPPECQ